MRILTLYFLFIVLACNEAPSEKAEDTVIPTNKFDQTKWKTKEGKDYPFRDDMMWDLIDSRQLKPLNKEEVINLLGPPDRVDSNFLFYIVKQPRLINWPLSTKALVIKLSQDSTENTILVHE